MITDKVGKQIELTDYEAAHGVGVQIGQEGHKVWVCVDGVAALRVRTPAVFLEDARKPGLRKQLEALKVKYMVSWDEISETAFNRRDYEGPVKASSAEGADEAIEHVVDWYKGTGSHEFKPVRRRKA